ncbi:MAG: hypothetical protein ACKO38_00765, partial [Planctomycetota bacterium]
GAEYKGEHGDHLTPSTLRENLIAGVLFVLCIICGVFPYQTILKYMDPTVSRQVRDLTDYARRLEASAKAAKEADSEAEKAVSRREPLDGATRPSATDAAADQRAVGQRAADQLAASVPVAGAAR